MRFTLQPYTTPSSRYRCPNCNDRARTFVRYIDTQTGQHVADHVGRCGRENNCGYHFTPGQYFREQGGPIVNRPWPMVNAGKRVFKPKPGESIVHSPMSTANTRKRVFRPKNKSKPGHRSSTIDHGLSPTASREPYDFLCIDPDIVNASFKQYDRNNFVQYLINSFGLDKADELVGRYRIGTAKHWPGSTVFWQLDTLGQVRTGKVMLYNIETGKRVKKPYNHITWAHSLLMRDAECEMRNEREKNTSEIDIPTSEFKLKQCLFGEHLLKEFPGKPVAIVESEKTAIMASACNDSFIWLACGSLSNLNAAMCKALNGKHVTLYPDLGAYDKWLAKARQLETAIRKSRFLVSRILEDHADDTDRKAGLDIGDFLERTNNT